jgi:hypothetical protein
MEPAVGSLPIQEVEWDLKAWTPITRVYDKETDRERSVTVVKFDFINLNVRRTSEPYTWPIASLAINYADPFTSRGEDRWSYLTDSVRKCAGRAVDIDELVGRRMRWAQEPRKLRANVDGSWVDAMQPCWVVLAIQGLTAPPPSSNGAAFDLTDHAASLADGKTDTEFYVNAVQDSHVTGSQEVVKMITDRTYVDFLITMGKLVREPDGVLRKAEAVEA